MSFATEYRISPVSLSAFQLRRNPPRPVHDRQKGYLDQFDSDTLFYDVFHCPAEDCIVALAPPPLNCGDALDHARFYLPGGAELVRSYRRGGSNLQMNCQFRLALNGNAPPTEIIMKLDRRETRIAVQPANRLLDDRKVVVTLSRNNRLEWIRDWAIFNARVHGADAILLYDNNSTEYSTKQIREALDDIPGLAAVVVISWPFPYGPGVGPSNTQDSFYCQPACLEHARWRFCGQAAGVLNTDIDELVISKSGTSVFEQLEISRKGAIEFPGIWCRKTTRNGTARGDRIRHRDCRDNFRSQRIARFFQWENMLCRRKWVAAPSRCPDSVDWGVHGVYPADQETLDDIGAWLTVSKDLCYRHFFQINSGWKTDRSRVQRYSPLRHVHDKLFARDCKVAFE